MIRYLVSYFYGPLWANSAAVAKPQYVCKRALNAGFFDATVIAILPTNSNATDDTHTGKPSRRLLPSTVDFKHAAPAHGPGQHVFSARSILQTGLK